MIGKGTIIFTHVNKTPSNLPLAGGGMEGVRSGNEL
jgi:hypothetical protein